MCEKGSKEDKHGETGVVIYDPRQGVVMLDYRPTFVSTVQFTEARQRAINFKSHIPVVKMLSVLL